MAATKNKPENKPTEPVNVEVLANHYQKTYEVAYENWRERNKLFVYLVLTASLGLVLLLRVPTGVTLLVAAIAKFLNITDDATKTILQNAFPFDILLSGILVVLFYLMQRLHSTNLSVMRTYAYLGELEKDIHPHLGLKRDSPSFTREGKFYWEKRTWIQYMSKFYYVAVLIVVLLPYMAYKLMADFESPNPIVIAVDIIISIMNVLYLVEYARSAFNLDKQNPEMAANGDSKPKKK